MATQSFLNKTLSGAFRLLENKAPKRFVLLMRKLERARQRKRYAAGQEFGAPAGGENSGLFFYNNRPVGGQATLLVLGSGRGGTSLVAGVLYHMGLFMGDECVRPSYEDQKLIREILDPRTGDARKTIECYSSRFDVWGFKQPKALDYIARHYKLFTNPRLIIVVKDAAAIAVRKMFVLGGNPIEHMKQALQDYEKILRFASRSRLPALFVSYEKIMSDPERFVDHLICFCGADVSSEERQAALTFVREGNEEYERFSLAKRNERMSTFCSHLDIVSTRQVMGWAASLAMPEPVDVMLTVDDREIATVLADRLREDVRDAGFHPTGRCGFQFDLSENAKIAPGSTVRVLIGTGPLEVAGSPKRIPV